MYHIPLSMKMYPGTLLKGALTVSPVLDIFGNGQLHKQCTLPFFTLVYSTLLTTIPHTASSQLKSYYLGHVGLLVGNGHSLGMLTSDVSYFIRKKTIQKMIFRFQPNTYQ